MKDLADASERDEYRSQMAWWRRARALCDDDLDGHVRTRWPLVVSTQSASLNPMLPRDRGMSSRRIARCDTVFGDLTEQPGGAQGHSWQI